jgi:hypothetical protein
MKHDKQRVIERKPKIDQPAVTPSGIDPIDADAFTRAIAWARQNCQPRDIKRLDDILQNDGFEAAGRWASYEAQYTLLRLKSWQCPPCHARSVNPRDIDPAIYGWRSSEVLLAARLVGANLSIFEPDPVAALLALGG